MKNVFTQNRIGSARVGSPNLSNLLHSAYTYVTGFRFQANQAKTLNSITLRGVKTGTLANTDFIVYLVRPFQGVAYKICTVSNGAATITLNGHGLANDEKILMFGTTLPTGASARGTYYYVVNTAANTFNLSLTQGGSAITWSSTGTNVCIARVLDAGTFDMANVSTANYYECTGFTYTFEVGRMYYTLMVNHNATPASNYLSIASFTNALETSNDFSRWFTTNLTAITQNTLDFGLNGSLNYSDGTKLECRLSNATMGTRVISAQYGTNLYYAGNVFKTMSDVKIRLIAIAWKIYPNYTTATTFSREYVCDLLDNSNNIIATSQVVKNWDYVTGITVLLPFYYDSVQVLEPSTTYKIRLRCISIDSYGGTHALNLQKTDFDLDSTGTYYHKQIWNDGSNGVMFLDSFYRNNGSAEVAESSVYYNCELWLDDTDSYDAAGGGSTYSYCFGN